MTRDFHVHAQKGGEWIVVRQCGLPLASFRRRVVAEAYGRALAHRAKVALIVHHEADKQVRYSKAELTYSVTL
ncbi:DUF2188 domain-containing protein [Hyphomicrobium sp.]|uniref:DUF2188 domain-containing protein n=1 Tax=Hyphomicrobium sp. TaxID=82 RepID=UPI0025B891E9|nr:DUF2188 domain-containing protein [Hyphomicrobium sp.]MCC7251353.1 DUF2188 domain-containing protein [Hyphomicrobium sp.]